jgi:hypothetical protein
MLATFLNLTRNGEQRFQFVGDFRGGVIAFDAINQIVISPRMFRCCSSVRQLAETAIVLRRNVVCDHFALSRGQSVRATKENVREFAQSLGAFRTNTHRAEYARTPSGT